MCIYFFWQMTILGRSHWVEDYHSEGTLSLTDIQTLWQRWGGHKCGRAVGTDINVADIIVVEGGGRQTFWLGDKHPSLNSTGILTDRQKDRHWTFLYKTSGAELCQA